MSDKKEVLVVASKVKSYINSTSGLKCSAKVIEILSDKVRELCDDAIASATNDKRKTVQEKDL